MEARQRVKTPGHLLNGCCLQRKGRLPKLISLICQPNCMLSYTQLLWRSILWIIWCTISWDWIRDNIPWSTHLTWTIHLFNMPNNRIVRHNELHSFMYLRNYRLVWLCSFLSLFFSMGRSCRFSWKAIVVQYGCLPWHLHASQLYLFFCIVPSCLAREMKIAHSAIYAIPATRLFYCLLNN